MAHTEETKAKIRKAWEKRRLTFVPPMKGKKMSEESRRKMSDAAKNRPSNRIGKPHTAETKARISAITRERTPRGAAHYAYRNGEFQRGLDDRRSVEYQEWRNAVYRRDGYVCQHCGDNKGGNLHAHHIKEFADYPDLRFVVENGLTLCQTCHEKVHLKPIPAKADLRRRKKHL